MTRCVYYRAYFHYACVLDLHLCVLSKINSVCVRIAICIDVLQLLRVQICDRYQVVVLQLGFEAASLPQDPSGLGGIDLSMGRFFEPGGLADRAIGPEGQLALLADRVNVVDWHIYTYMCLNEV